jgi:fructose-1,6-bisphosphatase/inositol monophosphatase family enzyme
LTDRHAAVGALLASVADRVIMPRFGRLRRDEIDEKSPGDWVTIVDRESEVLLAQGLHAIDPTARIIGEEAASADPTLLDRLCTGRVWLVDPLDGTNNFTEGKPPFGMLVAFVEDGVVRAGWIYDPVTRLLCHAERSGGAYIDGKRITAITPRADTPIATYSRYWLNEKQIATIEQCARNIVDLRPGLRCAAAQYVALVDGTHDIARFERIFP